MEENKTLETKEPIVEEKQQEEVVSMDTYRKEIDIPSNGYLGGPKKVTIRAMMASEEKILYSSRDFGFIKKICKACTVNPKVLDTTKLLPQDLMYMIYQIRELTFGPVYKQPIQCPHCGMRQECDINIADFSYDFLPEDVDEKLFIELPISKYKVHLRLLSQDEIDDIEKEASRLFQDGKIADLEGHSLMMKMTAMISSVVGMDFEKDNDKLSFVNKLHFADFNAIRNRLNSIVFGLKNDCTVVCQNKNCGEKVEVIGTICPEFFRPTV